MDATRAAETLRYATRLRMSPADLANFRFGDELVFYFGQHGDVLYPPAPARTPEQNAVIRALGPLPPSEIRRRAGRVEWLTAGGDPYRAAYHAAGGPTLVARPGDPGTPIRGVVTVRPFTAERTPSPGWSRSRPSSPRSRWRRWPARP